MNKRDWFFILLTLALAFVGVALVGWFVRDPLAALDFVTKLNHMIGGY